MFMKIYLSLFVICIAFISTQAQTYYKEFDKIAKDEVELVEYEKDKDAEAVVLFDKGSSEFQDSGNGYEMLFERETRIKILSEAGLEWAEVEIPFYQQGGSLEDIEKIEAHTYNFENGVLTKTKLKRGDWHDEKINENWSVRKFAFPNVKVGSIIEFKFRLTSPFFFQLRDWKFQWKIPVVYSEYQVKMIPFYQYTWLLQGASKFDQQESYEDSFDRHFSGIKYRDMVHKYIMTDVEAFKSEEYISTIEDYILKIDFQLSRINHPNGVKIDKQTTWPKMIENLLKHKDFGKYIKKSEKAAAKLLNVEALSLKSEEERFNEVIRFVKASYNWNNRYGKYASKTISDLINDKYGTAADLNLFAIGLLRAVGIEAYPVIISTRSNGKIKIDYPFSHFFNYVIISAKVNGKIVPSDATEVLLPNNLIPPQCINDRGLVVKDNEVKWVNLKINKPSSIKTYLRINATDSLVNADLKVVSTKYYALYNRKKYGENIDDIEEFVEDKGYELQDSSIVIKNQMDFDKAYQLIYSICEEPDTANNKLYINPFLNEAISENKLKQQTRSYPVDMHYPKNRTYVSSIQIPDGYEVDYIPENQKIVNELFEMNYNVINDGANVLITFTHTFKESVYSAEVYSKIKFYMNELVKKGKEKVVFVKSNAN